MLSEEKSLPVGAADDAIGWKRNCGGGLVSSKWVLICRSWSHQLKTQNVSCWSAVDTALSSRVLVYTITISWEDVFDNENYSDQHWCDICVEEEVIFSSVVCRIWPVWTREDQWSEKRGGLKRRKVKSDCCCCDAWFTRTGCEKESRLLKFTVVQNSFLESVLKPLQSLQPPEIGIFLLRTGLGIWLAHTKKSYKCHREWTEDGFVWHKETRRNNLTARLHFGCVQLIDWPSGRCNTFQAQTWYSFSKKELFVASRSILTASKWANARHFLLLASFS